MTLIVDEKGPEVVGPYRTAEDYINHFGIFPAEEGKYRLVYYVKSSPVDTARGKTIYYKKVINCSRKTYKVYQLDQRPNGVEFN